MKRALLLLLAIFVVFISYHGYQRHSFNKTIESTYPAIKNTSLRLSNSLNFETNKASITYKELFSKIEADIAEIDKHILTVQSASTDYTKEEMNKIIEYISASQIVLRSQLQVARKRLSVSISSDITERAIKAASKENLSPMVEIRLIDYAREAHEAQGKELAELRTSGKELYECLLDFIDSKNKVAFLPDNILVSKPLLEKVREIYQQ